MLLKICGVRETRELMALQAAEVDYAGLWHGIEGGHAELADDDLATLAGAARGLGIEPVLVTFLNDAEHLGQVIEASGVRHVQLHGFQPPALIAALRRRFGTPLRLIKVLHIQGETCLEGAVVPAYRRAGVDLFLLDSVTSDGRIGSTGRSLDPAAVLRTAAGLDRPFLLAGGLDAKAAARRSDLDRIERFVGIDADSAARDSLGRICLDRVLALHRAWRLPLGALGHAA